MSSARRRGASSPSPRGPAAAPSSGKRWRIVAAAVAVFALAGALIALRARTAHAVADLRPLPGQNLLLVTIDTLRADALSAYGGPAATPALDGLAGEGVRFTFAHAQAVLTQPSHTSILTGEYPYRHGVRDNAGYRLQPGTPTLATRLKHAGYATGAFVSAFPLHSRFGLNAGFDVYDDRVGETRAPTDFVLPERPASATVPIARAWIAERARAGDRWFAWVHVFDPHAPYTPPPPFDQQYAGREYYGEVAATDAALAPLFSDVGALDRPTLVIVTGDHGEALGDHGEQTHGLFAYEPTLRIPLIVAELGGGRTPRGGEVSNTPVRHVDIVPTALAALGQPAASDLPGRSLLAADARRDDAPSGPSYFESMSAMLNRGWAPLSGVVEGHDKYIELPLPELYDLARDPGETANLYDRESQRRNTLQAALKDLGTALPGKPRRESIEATEQLRSLGYVMGDAPIKSHYTEADDPKRLIEIDGAIHNAVNLYLHRQYTEAARIYRDVIARRPDMAIAYRHLAFVQWETGDVGGAIGVLERALQVGVKSAGIVTQLGTYLAESGHAPDAIALLQPAVDGAQPDLDALNGLGIAYAGAGRIADARRVFERMLAMSPDSTLPLQNLATLDLQAGRLADARARLERAALLDPQSSQAHAGLGVVAIKSGDRQRAVAEWKQAVALDPTNFDALFDLSTTLADAGDRAAAEPFLRQFVDTAPPALYARDIAQVRALLQSRR